MLPKPHSKGVVIMTRRAVLIVEDEKIVALDFMLLNTNGFKHYLAGSISFTRASRPGLR